ncbi:MAG: MATE family efflux transporter, partial [Bacteroidota bacterium]|nr:MATE family efflux transporter [Bacteroidota bacterium]
TQGFLPIAGFNYGAKKYDRVREVIFTSIIWACILGTIIFLLLILNTDFIGDVFTDTPRVIDRTSFALGLVFLSLPIISIQLIGAAYYQAIGKAIPALLLTLLRTAIILIPLLLILPNFFGETGVWISFPIADISATLITAYFLWKAMKKLKDNSAVKSPDFNHLN